jgi:hypothetical protein
MDFLLGLGTSIEHRKISKLRIVVFYACRLLFSMLAESGNTKRVGYEETFLV